MKREGVGIVKALTLFVASFAASAISTASIAQNAPSEIDAHIQAGRIAAGEEYRSTFINLCLPTPIPAGADQLLVPRPAPDPKTWYASPYKVFDNLYWLGTRRHSSWALQTGAGFILIDTNFAWATQPVIVEGMEKLGFKPSDIKYVIISHAHGDHDQGAANLQRRYGVKVVMGEPDWETTLKRAPDVAGGVPSKDIGVGPEGMKLTLGDTTVDIIATPGHTPGTLSLVFPVKDNGKTVTVAYSGGTLTGAFGADGLRWDEYIASQKKIAKAAADADATVLLSNHSEYDNAYTKARLISVKREPGEENPFIVGANSVQRYFNVMAECATASKLRNSAK